MVTVPAMLVFPVAAVTVATRVLPLYARTVPVVRALAMERTWGRALVGLPVVQVLKVRTLPVYPAPE